MNGSPASPPDSSAEAVRLHQSVTPETLTFAAEALGIDTEQHGSTVTIHAAWDDPRTIAIRRWAVDPVRFSRAALHEASTSELGLNIAHDAQSRCRSDMPSLAAGAGTRRRAS